MPASMHQALDLARHHQARGAADQAAAAYRAVLVDDPDHAESLRQLGVILLKQGQPDAAALLLARAFRLQPDRVDVLSNLGVAQGQRGQGEEAVRCFREVVRLQPDQADGHSNLGNALHGQGQAADAEACLRRALALQPAHADAVRNLGALLLGQGRIEEARELLEQAVRDRPLDGTLWLGLADVHLKGRRFPQAEAAYRRAQDHAPSSPMAATGLGISLMHQERWAEAIDWLRQARQRWQAGTGPGVPSTEALADLDNLLGVALSETEQHAEAVIHYQAAIQRRPGFAVAHSNLGLALMKHGDLDAAVGRLREALRLSPDLPDACTNLGLALMRQGDSEGPLAYLREAIRLRPDQPLGHSNLGNVLMDLARYEEARAPFMEALRLAPDQPEHHKQMAGLLLTLGEWEAGWREYEYRWGGKDLKPRTFRQPQWRGEPLEGRTVLLHVEQGMGDTIQFVRFASEVQARGGRVVLECVAELAALLRRCPGVDALHITGSARPSFDVHCPLLSLPLALGIRVDTVPAACPYLFPEPERLVRWRDELAGIDGLKVVIAWQGNPKYVKDRARSVPLRQFAPLAAVPGVQLLSVQKGPGTEQLAGIRDRFPVLDLGSRLDLDGHAFLDTAAVLCLADLVITTDTSLPHLAGALGRPVWLALGHAAEWRWLLDRDDSPWYPTMRLFRQQVPGDWEGTFARIAAALLARDRPAMREGEP